MTKVYKLEDPTKKYVSVDAVLVRVSQSVEEKETTSLSELDAKIATYKTQVKVWEVERVLVEAEAKKGKLSA